VTEGLLGYSGRKNRRLLRLDAGQRERRAGDEVESLEHQASLKLRVVAVESAMSQPKAVEAGKIG
jgi:hypothetical protein